jgi:hypothetical protein
MAGYISAAARELARYKLDLARVEEFKWDKGGTVTVEITIFPMERKRKSSTETRFFVH